MRRALAAVALLTVLPAPAVAQAQQWPDAIVYSGARVRVQFRDQGYLGVLWWTGITATSTAGCLEVVVDSLAVETVGGEPLIRFAPEPDPAHRARFPFRAVTRMQVSSLYHGRWDPGREPKRYAPGASLEGEEWLEVSLTQMRARFPPECAGRER
ncbi:MAG: hypothetical protein GTO22_05605 [Gemmatimonadales bacterium]|nr:hypothetical protein [Gemmatimonadales bacterium]